METRAKNRETATVSDLIGILPRRFSMILLGHIEEAQGECNDSGDSERSAQLAEIGEQVKRALSR